MHHFESMIGEDYFPEVEESLFSRKRIGETARWLMFLTGLGMTTFFAVYFLLWLFRIYLPSG